MGTPLQRGGETRLRGWLWERGSVWYPPSTGCSRKRKGQKRGWEASKPRPLWNYQSNERQKPTAGGGFVFGVAGKGEDREKKMAEIQRTKPGNEKKERCPPAREPALMPDRGRGWK